MAKFCPNCGSGVKVKDKFCQECGTALGSRAKAAGTKSRGRASKTKNSANSLLQFASGSGLVWLGGGLGVLALAALLVVVLRPGQNGEQVLQAPPATQTAETAAGQRQASPLRTSTDIETRKPAAAREKIVTARLAPHPEDPSKGRLGVSVRDLPGGLVRLFDIPVSEAVLVSEVISGGPAEAAGIEPGNVILSVAGNATPDTRALVRRVVERAPGEALSVRLLELAKTPDELVRILHREVSENGDPTLTSNLGEMYEIGSVVRQDKKKAVSLYEAAADKGNISAMFRLAVQYSNGDGIARNDELAAKWFREAASKGHADAMSNLGAAYSNGRGVAKDDVEAMRWFGKAADQGQAEAMRSLANGYSKGRGTTKDLAQAAQWYLKAAEAGDAIAMKLVGYSFMQGEGVKKNPQEARRWFESAIVAGDADAHGFLAIMYGTGADLKQDSEKAAFHFFEAIRHGDTWALEQMTSKPQTWSLALRRNLQRRMRDAGIYQGKIDGKFGPGTTRSIRALAGASDVAVGASSAAPAESTTSGLDDLEKLD